MRHLLSAAALVLALGACGVAASPPGAAPTCVPGTKLCDGAQLLQCTAEGQYVLAQKCKTGAICQGGACLQPAFADAGAEAGSADTDASETALAKDAAAELPDGSAGGDAVVDAVSAADAKDAAEAVDSAPDGQKDTKASDVALIDIQKPDGDQPFNPGPLKYERLGNDAALDDLHRVLWHPGGTFALILGTKGAVLRYDAGQKQLVAATTLGSDVVDLAVDPKGKFFLIVGVDSGGGARLWRADVAATGTVIFGQIDSVEGGEPTAVAADPLGGGFAVATRKGNPEIDTLSLWQDGKGVTQKIPFATGSGIRDLMWAGTNLGGLAGSNAVVLSQGINGGGSMTWVVATNKVVANGWSPGFGNGGGAAWRPGGSYGIVTGWTSNVVYVFAGTWQSTYLPGVNSGASPQAVAWNELGTRALVVGRATGAQLAATVSEHRPGKVVDYPASVWLDQSISGFDANPWNGNLNTQLRDVSWRPNATCDEGLIVGSDSGETAAPGYGLLIHFWDANDPACAPVL